MTDDQGNQQLSDDQNNQPQTVRVGGMEGDATSFEAGASSSPEKAETLKPAEGAPKVPETSEKRNQPSQQKPRTRKFVKPKEIAQEEKLPKIYGYKVPPQIADNKKQIAKKKGKGDPKNGLSALYIFLDRLLRKKPIT